MVLGTGLTFSDIPLVLTGVVFVGLAVWLMIVNPGSRLNQAFALFLVVRGMHNGLIPFQTFPYAIDADDLVTRVNGYFEIAIPFATFYFLYIYLRHYGRIRPRPWIPGSLLLLALFFMGLLMADPSLRFGTGEDFGPLMLFVAVNFTSYAVTALVLGIEYLRTRTQSRRHALYLVALGFSLDPLAAAPFFLLTLIPSVAQFYNLAGPDAGIHFTLISAIGAFTFIPLGLLAWALVRGLRTANDGTARKEIKRFLLFMPVPILATFAVVGLQPLAPSLAQQFDQVFNGIWALALGLLALAAILRHQLFGLDVKLKRTVKGGTLFAFFLFLFFILSEGSQAVLEHQTGSALVAVLGAGLIVFAIAPLQRVADRITNAAMPGVKPISQMGEQERAELFQEWARLAWSDGNLAAKERRMLDLARERLGLSADDAVRLERDAMDG